MVACEDCKLGKPSVKLCQGDLMLCSECNEIRFPSIKRPEKSRSTSTAGKLTVGKAASAVLSANVDLVNKMNLEEITTLNTNNMMPTIRASLSSILPRDTDRTEVANHAMDICQKLKTHALARKSRLEATEQLSVSQSILVTLNTPLRQPPMPAQGSPILTTPIPLTADRVPCVDACLFQHLETKNKPLECSLCRESYHRECVGLKPNARPSTWICTSCKLIPQAMKQMSQRQDAQDRTIEELRNENQTLARLVEEQRSLITELYDSMKTKVSSETASVDKGLQTADISEVDNKSDERKDMTATPTKLQERNGTLLIGDSMIRDVNERGLIKTSVKCISGGKVRDIKEDLDKRDFSDLDTLIVHVGTNNCSSDEDLQTGIRDFKAMLEDVHARAPTLNTIISSVCPRDDNSSKQERVLKLNAKLRNYANDNQMEYVDHDSTFLEDNKIKRGLLTNRGLHLSKSGTRTLLGNLNRAHTMFYTRSLRTTERRSDQESTGHGQNERPKERRQHRITRGHVRRDNRVSTYSGCYNCGGTNHKRYNCRYRGPVECFSCGELGHLSYFCVN